MTPHLVYNEKEFVTRIAAGDEFAFEVVFNTYKDRIYAIAFRLGQSQTVAEDMVQEVFLTLWIHREKLAGVDHFRAYLYTIARNHIVRHLKKLASTVAALTDEALAPEGDVADHRLLEREYGAILAEAINRLSPQQALVYRLSKQEGLKREEIAARLGLSPDTVKAHLYQAMKDIRAYCLWRLDLLLLFWILKK